MEMKLHVDDLIVRTRAVEVPAKCPGCGADLMKEGAIKVFEYQDQHRSAHLIDSYEHSVEFENDLPQQGETWFMILFECQACEHELAHAREEHLCSESLAEEMEDYYVHKGNYRRMEAAKELAEEILGKRRSTAQTEDEDPDDHIEILRRHLIGGWGYTIDLIEDLCKKLLEKTDGP
jgi:hypothetical protein